MPVREPEVVNTVKERAISLNIETSITEQLPLAHTSLAHFTKKVTAHATRPKLKMPGNCNSQKKAIIRLI